MIILILVLAGMCAVIAAVGYFAIRHNDLKDYRDAIIIVCALFAGAIVIFGIFAFDMNDGTKSADASAPSSENATVKNVAAEPEASNAPDATVPTQHEIQTQATIEPTSALGHKPGDIIKDCDLCPEMVVIPAGDNHIGEDENTPGTKPNEHPLAWIVLTDRYAVGRYEVKVSEFKHFAAKTNFKASGPCNTDGVGGKNADFNNPGMSQGPEHPVVCVSVQDAQKYSEWLSKETGQTYKLLSEARWEYARRSETSVDQEPATEAPERMHVYGNIRGKTWIAKTMDVGRFDANQFLLFDMIGNAAEWTTDCWQDNNMLRPKDGRAVVEDGDCNARAVRGGSWDERSHAARPASRRKVPAELRDWRIGFRVMRLMDSEGQTRKIDN